MKTAVHEHLKRKHECPLSRAMCSMEEPLLDQLQVGVFGHSENILTYLPPKIQVWGKGKIFCPFGCWERDFIVCFDQYYVYLG